ncbi:MAG: metal-dependent hydrolase [Xenococcus sp. MO_188.B8]|nr:metal-dependent hydrolase [Xenococcus sp. MO_188.B8]
MMAVTHTAFSLTFTSLALGTANPVALLIAAVASQFPDIDTSKSTIGRFFLPISRFIEQRLPHRSITHSFLVTGIFTLATYPITFVAKPLYWQALVLGYFFGWFADVFTKSGVAAFYPSKARLVIPGNPRLRLATGSNAEWFVLFILIAFAILSIQINSAGGIVRSFNQILGLPSGAIEAVNQDSSRYLLTAQIKGRNAITQEPIEKAYEIIQPLNQNDLLVKDELGTTYRVGNSQECQIVASKMKIERVAPITTKVTNLFLDDEDLYEKIAALLQVESSDFEESNLNSPQNWGVRGAKSTQTRTYLSGTLTIFDADDLILPTHIDRYDTITLQPGSDIAYARLIAASPGEVLRLLGDYYASGNLVVRIVKKKV